MNTKNIYSIPWSAWYEDSWQRITFPDNWQVDYFALKDEKSVPDDDVQREAEKLIADIAKKKPRSIVIAIDDLTRPLSYKYFLNTFLKLFQRLKLNINIIILFGLGTHKRLDDFEIKWKIGEKTYNNNFVTVINHNYKDDVIYAGFDWGKIPVKINKYFLESDYRIILSTIVPHPFAGFSGGAKMVLPGLSNIEITKRTHQMAMMGFIGKAGGVKNNKFRKILDQFIDKIEVNYFIGFLTNENRHCIKIKGGKLHDTYYSLTEDANKIYSTAVRDKIYDIIWLNAYPKDSELLQIDTAFVPVYSSKEKFWHYNSTFIVSAACNKGLGHHALFGPGGILYHKPREKRKIKGNPVKFLLPGINKKDFTKIFWQGYHLYHSFDEVINSLDLQYGKNTHAAIFPYASIQLVK